MKAVVTVLAALFWSVGAASVSEARTPQPFAVLPNFAAGVDFSDAGAITTGPDGSVYVVRGPGGQQRLEVFAATGQLLRTVSAFDPAGYTSAVAVDRERNLYAAGARRVQKFDSSGNLIDDDWGRSPADDIATGGGQVATIEDGQLRRLTPDGALLQTFANPRGRIAMDSAATVYVASFDAISAYGADGSFRSIGTLAPQGRSPNPNEFGYFGAAGVAVTATGELYSSDSAEGRILRFDAVGYFLSSCGHTMFKPRLQLRSFATAPNGSLLVVDGSHIRHLSPNPAAAASKCLDRNIYFTSLAVKPMSAPASTTVSLWSSARATAQMRLYRLRSKTAPVPRPALHAIRFSPQVRYGNNRLSLGSLARGRYCLIVKVVDAYGNNYRSSIAFTIHKRPHP